MVIDADGDWFSHLSSSFLHIAVDILETVLPSHQIPAISIDAHATTRQ